MATVIDALVITLGIDPRGVSQGMQQAESRLQSGVRNIMSNVLAPLAGALAFTATVSNFLETATAVDQVAESLGMGVERWQEWTGAARMAGGDADQLADRFRDMSDYIQDLDLHDSGPLKDATKDLGINVKDANGKLKDTESVMLEIADKFSQMDKQKAMGIGMQLSFDEGTIQLLQKGRKGVEELMAKQREMGVYSRRDIEMAKAAKTALGTLSNSLQMGATLLMRFFIPALTQLADKLSAVVMFLRRHEPAVIAFFTVLATIITARMVPALWAMARAALANPMVWIFAAIAAAVAAVALVIDDLYAYMTGGESKFAAFWGYFGTGEEISAKLTQTWEALKSIGGSLIDVAINLAKWLTAVFTLDTQGFVAAAWAIWDALVNIFNKVLEIFGVKDGFYEMLDAVTAGFQAAAAAVIAAWEGVKQWFTDLFADIFSLWDKAAALPGKAMDVAKGIGSGIADTAGGLWDSAKDFVGIGGAKEAVRPAAAAQSGNRTITNDMQVNVASVTVNTQATDAQGVASGIGGALNNELSRTIVNPAAGGVR